MTKRWKCTICGYVHTGETPPAICPVCGADRSAFIPIEEEKSGFLRDLIANFKLHPVAAHFPNGLIPTAALFLLLYVVSGNTGFESTCFRLIVVATLVVPVSMVSGLLDWRKHFGRPHYSVFFKKIGLALSLLVLALVAIGLRYGDPALMTTPGWQRWAFGLCLLGMLNCTILLGHYGSILASWGGALDLKATPEPDSRSRLQALFDQSPDAVLATDGSGVIEFWNRGAERIFGIAADRAMGQSLDLIIPENLRQQHWQGWARVMRTGAWRSLRKHWPPVMWRKGTR